VKQLCLTSSFVRYRIPFKNEHADLYPPSQKAANSSWRMNAGRVSAKAVLAMRRIASFIANMISAGGCASAGFAEAGASVPPNPIGGAP